MAVAARLDVIPQSLFEWTRTEGNTHSPTDDVLFERLDGDWIVRRWAREILQGEATDAELVDDALGLLASNTLIGEALGLAVAEHRFDRAVPLAEQEASKSVLVGLHHRALQIVDQIPVAHQTFELRLNRAAAGLATNDHRPSESTLQALANEGRTIYGRPSPRAHALLANHLRMCGDARVVEVCLEAIGLLTELSQTQASLEAKKLWSAEHDRVAAAELLRYLGQITSLIRAPGNVSRGRNMIETALLILEDEGSSSSQHAWLKYTEALMFVRTPESVIYNVRTTAMELWRAGHSDSALRLGELASLCYFAGRFDESRSTIEIATEAAAATGNNMAAIPLACLGCALDVIDDPRNAILVDRFEAGIGELLDHGHLATFHLIYAAEFGLLQLGLGNRDTARRFSEIAQLSPLTALSASFAMGAQRLAALVDPDPDSSRAALEALRTDAAAYDRSALVALIDNDLATRADEPTETFNASPEFPGEGAVSIFALGPSLVVRRGEHTLPSLVGYSAKLLAILIVSSGVVAVDVVLEALWPGVEPGVGRNRLHGVLLRLRRALGFGPEGPITCADDMVRLVGAEVRCDAWDFVAATSGKGDASPVTYPGDLLSEQFPYDDRIEEYRRHLRHLASRVRS